MKLKEQFFDFEVFPNWWCCVIGRYPEDDNIPEKIKDDFFMIDSDIPCAREKLLQIMGNKEYCNFGYNIKYYDNIILNGIANGFTPRQLKILNDIIINPETQYQSQEAMRIAPFAKKKYQNFVYQDIFDDSDGSLKQKEACMQLDIRESTVDFDKEDLTDEDKLEIIDYCKHDVWSSMKFYKLVTKNFVSVKLSVSKTFDIPLNVCYKSTSANLSGHVLGATRTSYIDRERLDFVVPENLKEYIKYSLPDDIVKRICASPEKFDCKLFNNIVSFANGGVHSIPCNNIKVKSNDEWTLINVDASSFYPAMMIYHNVLSRSVSKPDLFKDMYLTRLAIKNGTDTSKDAKDKNLAYKLILNATFGASGNKYLDLFDAYMCTSTCRLGQLLITSLANNVYNQVGKNEVQIVQTNTDGILFYIKKSKIDLLRTIGDEWTRITSILLEYEYENATWQRDVNNYIICKDDGTEKARGNFFVSHIMQPGYNKLRPLDNFVCKDAIKEYLKSGKDIVEHIYNETDLSKFVITCHKGSFSGIVRAFNDGRPDEILHKVNRVYASMNRSLGMIFKTKKMKGELKKYKAPGCPFHCELINESLDKYDMNKLRDDIDYMWYIEQALDMLNDQWYEMQADKIVPIKIYEE